MQPQIDMTEPVTSEESFPVLLPENKQPKEVSTHMVNLIHMTLALLGLHIAYNSLQNIASSVEEDSTVASYSFAVMNTFYTISSLLIGPFIVSYLGARVCLLISSLTYVIFLASHVSPMPITVLTSGALLGIGAGVLWTAQGTYLTYAATNYALNLQQTIVSCLGKFNGVFYGIFQANLVVGNIITGLVLTFGRDESSEIPRVTILVLMLIFVAIALVSSVSLLLLRVESAPEGISAQQNSATTLSKVFSAVTLCADKRILLLIPIMFYSGFEESFIFGNFNLELVRPSVGAHSIGWIMTTFGIVDVISAWLTGKLASGYGLGPVVLLGFLGQAGMLVPTLFIHYYFKYWGQDPYGVAPAINSTFSCSPTLVINLNTTYFDEDQCKLVEWISENPWYLYVVASLFSVGDAAWNTFPSFMMGYLFNAQCSVSIVADKNLSNNNNEKNTDARSLEVNGSLEQLDLTTIPENFSDTVSLVSESGESSNTSISEITLTSRDTIKAAHTVEAAYSNYKFFRALGQIVPFLLVNVVGFDIKMLLTLGLLLLGVIGILWLHGCVQPILSNKRMVETVSL